MLMTLMRRSPIKAALMALVILLPLAWAIARHWGFSQKTPLKSSEHAHAKIQWWKEIGITLEQKRRLNELDKVYREQARKYLILWKQKMRELYETDPLSSNRECILKLAKEVGDAYSKFEMIQAMRRSALSEILTKEQKEKLKALIKHTASHTNTAQRSESGNGGEGCGCGSCCN